MSKLIATFFVMAVVGSSFWFYPMLPEQIPNGFADYGNPSSFVSKEIVLISEVVSVIVVYITMIILSRVMQSKSIYKRFQKSMNDILMVVILIVSASYAGVIANGLGYEVNMLLLAPLGVGFAFIVIGNTIQRFKADTNTGIPLSDAHSDLWNKMRRFFSRALFVGGLLLIPCVLFPIKIMFVAFLIVLSLTVIVILLGSYIVYKKQYINPSN